MNAFLLGSAREFDTAWRAAWVLEGLREVCGAVAYVSDAGAQMAQNCWHQNPAELRLLCGVEEATQASALERLVKWRGANSPGNPALEFAWFASSQGRFHPKFWLFTARDECQLFVGSSNLTAGGHGRNVEAGALLRFEPGTQLHLAAREIFAGWWQNSRPLQQRLVDQAASRDEARARERDALGADTIGDAWQIAVDEGKAEPKSVPLPEVSVNIEQRVLALLKGGVVVELTASARNLFEQFEGNPFEISESHKFSSDLLQISRSDLQRFCVLSKQTKASLDSPQDGARKALNRFSYPSPWGDFMPYATFTSWHKEQSKNRSKYKDGVEKNFASEEFWREEKERLRCQMEQVSREAWRELHSERPQIPRKNLQQIIYQTQRAFDRRHGELRNSVALHY